MYLSIFILIYPLWCSLLTSRYDSPYLFYTLSVYGSSIGNVLALNNLLKLLLLLPSLLADYYQSPCLQMKIKKLLNFYSQPLLFFLSSGRFVATFISRMVFITYDFYMEAQVNLTCIVQK